MLSAAPAAVAFMTRVAADIEVLGLRKLFRQTVAGEEVVAIQHLDFNIRSGQIVHYASSWA